MRLVSTVIGLMLAVAAVPALAESPSAPATQGRAASVAMAIRQSDGTTLIVSIRAVDQAHRAGMNVKTQVCGTRGCDSPDYYAGPLTQGAFTVDSKTAKASLVTRLGGFDLSVGWRPSGAAAVVGGSQFSGNDSGESGYVDVMGKPADVVVSLGHSRCSGSGSVSDAVDFATAGGSVDSPLARLALKDQTLASC